MCDEPGLVANWRMDTLEGGTVPDATGGTALSVGTITGTGWVESTPEVVHMVSEDASVGTVVATLAAVDGDAGQSHTYRFVDADGADVAYPGLEIVGNEYCQYIL